MTRMIAMAEQIEEIDHSRRHPGLCAIAMVMFAQTFEG